MPKKSKNSRKRLLNVSSYNLATSDNDGVLDLRSLTLRKMEVLDYLNGTNMPTKFRFREQELEKIDTFLQTCVKKEKKGYRFLMVTGSPGAGKTLCINSALTNLDCEVIRLNANIVKTLADVQQLITLKLLGDSKPRTAPQIVRQLQQQKYTKTCIIYIQEIELLFKAAPTILTEDFLTLFQKKSVNLVLLGISNTIDTLQKYSSRYSFSIVDIENAVFAPYTAEHIKAIMEDKLKLIKEKYAVEIEFSEKLLKFASQKLETLRKGDFRICMEFMKELVRESFQRESSEELEEPRFVIGIGLINEIFNNMQISKNYLMTKLPYQLKILLIGLHNITVNTEALYISMSDLKNELKWIYNSLQINFSHQVMEDRLKDLEQYAMVSLRKKKNFELQIILQVALDEIRTSFEDNELLNKFFTEKK